MSVAGQTGAPTSDRLSLGLVLPLKGNQVDGFVRAQGDRTLHLPLTEAAARTFYRVTGRVVPDDPLHRERTLSSVAHALSNLIPIYVLEDARVPPRQVTPCECLLGTFTDGATALALCDGKKLGCLTVRVMDLSDAVQVLRSVKAWFLVADAPPPPHRPGSRANHPN